MEDGCINLENKYGHLQVFIYEIIGTAMLFIGINFGRGNPAVSLGAIYLALMVTANATGGNFNLGLTSAVFLVEGKYRY